MLPDPNPSVGAFGTGPIELRRRTVGRERTLPPDFLAHPTTGTHALAAAVPDR
ncbi:hypothetical protein [Embleya sp. NPDC020630]|uniref:hypothetical protein n=1 Tax=Embleya sp. NPDC020630 TaxID=3363979 RepID=UPI0037A92ADD